MNQSTAALALLLAAVDGSKAKGIRTAVKQARALCPQACADADGVADCLPAFDAKLKGGLKLKHFLAACLDFGLRRVDLKGITLGIFDGGQGRRFSLEKGKHRRLGSAVR